MLYQPQISSNDNSPLEANARLEMLAAAVGKLFIEEKKNQSVNAPF